MKLLKALYGFLLFIFNVRVFSLENFKNKRIAIIGPASSAFNTNNGAYIDSFDIVVRVNKSALLIDHGKNNKDVGTRTDILFHCFLENTYSGGGPLDFKLYTKQGIQFVINPRNELSGLRNTFNFYKKYLKPQRTYVLTRSLYNKIDASVGGFRPTTGYSALVALMESEFSELYIAGFTFFKTAYGIGYRDEMKEAAAANKFIKEVNLHNPDAEFLAFKRLLEKHNAKNIIMDNELTTIIRNEPDLE